MTDLIPAPTKPCPFCGREIARINGDGNESRTCADCKGFLFPAGETSWMDDAVCTQVDPELMFPTVNHGQAPPGIAVCQSCPVIAECGLYALERPSLSGIWGGMTERTRREIRGNRRRRAAA